MRIVCQKCAAAYAIDDRLISPKGVRAQCPRCRHLQLVKRDPSAASAAAPSAAAPGLGAEPRSNPAAPPAPGPEPRSNPRAPAAAPRAPAPRPAAPASDLFGDFGTPPPAESGADPFADLGMPAAAPPTPAAWEAAPPLGGDPLLDFLGPPPSGIQPAPVARIPSPGAVPVPVTPPAAQRPTPAPAPAPAKAPVSTGCRSCGKELTDAFDQALGICDDCRQRQPAGAPAVAARPSAPPLSAPPSSTPPPVEMDLPPLSPLDPSTSPLAPEPRSNPRASAAPALGAEPRSSPRTSTAPALGVEPRSGVRPVAAPRTAHLTPAPARVARADSGGGGKKVLAGGLAVLLLGGAGAVGYFLYLKPRQEAAEKAARPVAPPPVPEAVQAVLERWKLQYLELEGTAAEKLAEGEKLLAKDQRAAYADAEESFQQALLLDPRSDAAIAGYVQALALGRGGGMDDATFQEGRSLVEAAEARAGRTPALLVAHVNLLLARIRQPQQLEGARTLAESLLAQEAASPAQKAEAHLVLGRAFLSTSKELAREHFDAAQALAPELKRVHYYRALAHEAAGEYALALEKLRKRLELDPQDWDSLAATARIYQEVGEPAEARKLYEARAKAQAGDVRAPLALAVLRYQAEDNPSAAVRELRALLKSRNRYASRDVAEALVHLAAAERAAGNADAAAKAAEDALAVAPNLPEAHLQLFIVDLGRKDAAKARPHLAAFQGRLEDPALEKVLEGRLLLLEKKPGEALERFQQAVELDGRRLDAQLLAGVAAAESKRRDDAFRALFQALQGDPERLAPRPAVTRFWLRPEDTVAGTEGVILALGEGRSEDVLPVLYEGLLRFHQGALDVAERYFRDVLEVDSNNAGALTYRALIALRRDNASAARGLATQAVGAGRQLPVAHLAQGLALAESRQVEPAKRALRDALSLSPSLLSAQTKLAELESAAHADSARGTLQKVVGLDPEYLPAKRLLYLLDRRG